VYILILVFFWSRGNENADDKDTHVWAHEDLVALHLLNPSLVLYFKFLFLAQCDNFRCGSAPSDSFCTYPL
jgi:hypothetical protein